MTALLPPLFLLLLAAGHAGADEHHAYRCHNTGEALHISLGEAADGRPQAIVHRPDGDLVLPQVAAATGARYRAGATDLHIRGDEALYDAGDGRQLRCSRSTRPTAPPQAASSFIDLAGSVGYRTRNALPPDAILTIRVLDVARAGVPPRVLAEQRYELNGAPGPIPFTATIDRDLVGKRSRLQVAARIDIAGKLHYINDRPYPALKNGQPQPLDIRLKRVAGAKGG